MNLDPKRGVVDPLSAPPDQAPSDSPKARPETVPTTKRIKNAIPSHILRVVLIAHSSSRLIDPNVSGHSTSESPSIRGPKVFIVRGALEATQLLLRSVLVTAVRTRLIPPQSCTESRSLSSVMRRRPPRIGEPASASRAVRLILSTVHRGFTKLHARRPQGETIAQAQRVTRRTPSGNAVSESRGLVRSHRGGRVVE